MTSVTAGGVPFGTQIHLVAEDDPEGIGIIFAAEDGTDRAGEVARARRAVDADGPRARRAGAAGGRSPGGLPAQLARAPHGELRRLEGGGHGRPDALGPPRVGAGTGAGGHPAQGHHRCGERRVLRGQPLGAHHPARRGGAPAGVGHLQLGVDRDTQGDRAGYRGAVLPRSRGELRRGGLRRHARSRNWSWCRRRCTTRTASRRRGISWPASASCCSNGSTPNGSSTWSSGTG